MEGEPIIDGKSGRTEGDSIAGGDHNIERE
jgi:hypothetical protein